MLIFYITLHWFVYFFGGFYSLFRFFHFFLRRNITSRFMFAKLRLTESSLDSVVFWASFNCFHKDTRTWNGGMVFIPILPACVLSNFTRIFCCRQDGSFDQITHNLKLVWSNIFCFVQIKKVQSFGLLLACQNPDLVPHLPPLWQMLTIPAEM